MTAVDCFLRSSIGCRLRFALKHTWFETQSSPFGDNHTTFDHVLQFSNVSRPRILLHSFQRTLLDLANLLSHARRQPRREVIYQHGNIINAFAQGRNLNRKNIQPIKKVHAKRSEEHTSELQSPCNLVCRLLLEKKKKSPTSGYASHSR